MTPGPQASTRRTVSKRLPYDLFFQAHTPRRTHATVLIEPNVYVYYNATYQKNRDPPHYQPGRYSTDVVAESAVEFLEHAASDEEGRPFLVNVMPVGPHFEREFPAEGGLAGSLLYPPVPAKRHEHLFPDATVPRTENFNPETVGFLLLWLAAPCRLI